MGKKTYFQTKEDPQEVLPDADEVQGAAIAESDGGSQEEFVEAEFVMTNPVAEQWLKNAGFRKVESFSSIRFAVESDVADFERMAAFLAEKALRKDGSLFVPESKRSLGAFNRMVRDRDAAGSLVVLKKPNK
jgi:hypothetical protein